MRITFIKPFKINNNEKNKNKINKTNITNKREESKSILKKNQVSLIILSLMIITAAYMNYLNESKIETADLGDAKLVNTNTINDEKNEEYTEIASINEIIENAIEIESQIETETDIDTNTNTDSNYINTAVQNDYFSQTKLERDTMYSQMLESYQKILENSNIENEQKNIAAEEIKNINNRKSTIATIENLLKTKNMNESVILINDNSINVIIKSKETLNDEQIAQIYNIVSRELNTNIEDIHITTHS